MRTSSPLREQSSRPLLFDVNQESDPRRDDSPEAKEFS